jgi:two-component system NtrC family response regulator
MCEGKYVFPNDLELQTAGTSATRESLREIREKTEREHIQKALERNNWNISRAASELDVSRPTLHDLIKKHRIGKER